MLFTEYFKINTQKLESLNAYELTLTTENNRKSLGNQVAYYLSKMTNHTWCFSKNMLISNCFLPQNELETTLSNLWNLQKKLTVASGIKCIHDFKITVKQQADFVKSVFEKHYRDISKVKRLEEHQFDKNILIYRECKFIAEVIQNQPCIGFDLKKSLSLKDDLETYFKNKSNSIESLLKLQVKAKYFAPASDSVMNGIITNASLLLTEEHRQRLLNFVDKDSEAELFIQNATLGMPIIQLNGKYEYVINALEVSLSQDNLSKFTSDYSNILMSLKNKPDERFKKISKIATFLNDKTQLLDLSHSDQEIYSIHENKATPYFFKHDDIFPNLEFLAGQNNTLKINNLSKIITELVKSGLYKNIYHNRPIKIGIISTTDENIASFLKNLNDKCNLLKLQFETVLIDNHKVNFLAPISTSQIEKIVNSSLEQKPDIILAILPSQAIQKSDDENASGYYDLKRIALKSGIPTQVVNESSLHKSDISFLGNILLGILSKIGNVPYVLKQKFEFTDHIVGLDIGRYNKSNQRGTMNTLGMCQIYDANGEFLRYHMLNNALEGETIPLRTIKELFPMSQFENKRILVHRDGIFRGDEIQNFIAWGKEINAHFDLVEVTKSGVPKIYNISSNYNTYTNKIISATKGCGFYLNDKEAMIVTSIVAPTIGMPKPLRIKIVGDSNLTIQQALQSVLALTYLHHGSIRQPRLPITTYFSDQIAYLSRYGIQPMHLSGNIPYWL